MGEKQAASPALVMVVLLLFAAASQTAHGSGPQGPLPVLVNGVLCCSSTGNCNGTAAGIPGVPVNLNCTTRVGGASAIVGQGVTGATGGFNISVPNLLSTLGITLASLLGGNRIVPCATIVNLPINQTVCPILNNATGILAGVPTLLSATVSPILGTLLNLTVPLFVNVSLT